MEYKQALIDSHWGPNIFVPNIWGSPTKVKCGLCEVTLIQTKQRPVSVHCNMELDSKIKHLTPQSSKWLVIIDLF